MPRPIDRIQAKLVDLRAKLLEHEVYRQIDGISALRCFMEHHVFAVWDFMSLLKALQRKYTCVYMPWTPASNTTIARFINEIVIGEETDEDGRGGFASHFDLYRRAMRQFGADTAPIDSLNSTIHDGGSLGDALSDPRIPAAAQRFVRDTFDIIESSDSVAILSAFTFGREDLLPAVFQRIVDELNVQSSGGLAEFQYYLQRHIGLDGDEHGPMAQRLIELVCGENEAHWQTAEESAVKSLTSRLTFWDGISAAIRQGEGR
jgi:hypothetical protein